MTKKDKIDKILEILKRKYPNAVCSLEYDQPYRLLLATRLSAQCTDARVNVVTQKLFKKYPTLNSLANADVCDVINIVKPCGLGNTKGRDLVNICKKLVVDFNSTVPDNMDELLTLPGVGRKTANLILGDVYKKPAVVADTHLIRITNRLGFVNTKDPKTVEFALAGILPPEESSDFCHRVVLFGREICNAKNPKCELCELFKYCKYGKSLSKNHKS